MDKPGKTTLYFDPELRRLLKVRAAETGKTLTQCLEEAVRAYLARRASPRERRPHARPK